MVGLGPVLFLAVLYNVGGSTWFLLQHLEDASKMGRLWWLRESLNAEAPASRCTFWVLDWQQLEYIKSGLLENMLLFKDKVLVCTSNVCYPNYKISSKFSPKSPLHRFANVAGFLLVADTCCACSFAFLPPGRSIGSSTTLILTTRLPPQAVADSDANKPLVKEADTKIPRNQ